MTIIPSSDTRHQAGSVENPHPAYPNRNALAPEIQRRRHPIEDVPPPPVELQPFANQDGYFCLPERFRHLKLSAADWSIAALMGSKVSIIGHPCMWAEGKTFKDLALAIARELKLGRSTVEMALKKFRKAGAVSWRCLFWRAKDTMFLDFSWALRRETPRGQAHQPAPGRLAPGRPRAHYSAPPPLAPAPGGAETAPGAGPGAVREDSRPPNALVGPPSSPGADSCAPQTPAPAELSPGLAVEDASPDARTNVNVDPSGLETTSTSVRLDLVPPVPEGLDPGLLRRFPAFAKLADPAPAAAPPGSPRSGISVPRSRPVAAPAPSARPKAARIVALAGTGSGPAVEPLRVELMVALGDSTDEIRSVRFHRRSLRLIAQGELDPAELLKQLAAFRASTARDPLRAFTTNFRARLVELRLVDPNPHSRPNRRKSGRPERVAPSPFAAGLAAGLG